MPTAILAVCLSLAHPAWAHHFMGDQLPQTFLQGFLSGVGHPVIGLDHAAFIVCAGLLLALVERGLWAVAALILGSLIGAAIHLAGVSLPANEAAVALSVILIGALVMAAPRIGLPWLAAGLMLAGIVHGHAYAETIFGAEPTPLVAYLLGFSLIQFAVAAGAFFVHRRLIGSNVKRARVFSSALGAAAGAVGIIALIGAVAQ